MADPQDTSADDYLQSVLQGAPAPADAAPAPMDATQAAPDPAAPTAVSGITVAPQAKPDGSVGMNYQAPDLAASANSVKQAMNSSAFQPQGGGANPGVWGLLPPNMQHGTLRNVLGALGDAFLVGSGKQAQYEPRMERQQEGLAMADYDEHPELSRGLLGATGAPDAVKDVIGLQENQNNLQLHKDQLTQQNQYRNDQLQIRQQQVQDALKSRNDNVVARLTPQIGGLASRAQTPQDYATAYSQAEKIAQRVGPDYHATDFGLVDPTDWKPGMVQGTTAGQQLNSADKGAQRGVSVQNNTATNRARIQAAGITAGSKLPTEASQVDAIRQKVNSGQPLSPGDQAVWDKQTNIKKSSSAVPLTDAAKAAAANGPKPAPGGQQQYSAAQAAGLPKGTHFQGQDGKWYIR
jgi:hypothetical protein